MIMLISCMQINIKVFYKLIKSNVVGVARHAQSAQNKKFAISLQNLRKEMKDEGDFWHGNKHQSFLQVDTIVFGTCGKTCPKCPQ